MYKTKLSDKFVIAIFIAFNLWICNVSAQLGNCDVTEGQITLLYRDVTPGILLENPIEIEMIFTTGVVSHTEANSVKYFEVIYDDALSALLINTADNFVEYEKEQSAVERLLTVTLNCANSQTRVMFLTMRFQEVNHFTPEFTKTDYEFEIPLPLPVGFDIFSFITDKISATDYDLHFNQITFTSDMIHPFKVETSSVTSTLGKEFFASIITTEKILNIRNGLEFQITATDSFIGDTKSDTANVKITSQASDEEFIEVPIFTQSLYFGTIDFQQPTPLTIDQTITLISGTYVPTIKFALDLSDSIYFDLTSTDDTVKITLKETVTEDDLLNLGITQLSFVVTATRLDDIFGNAAVLINIIPKRYLAFDQTLYTGTIGSDMLIDHQLIKLSDAYGLSDIELSITNDALGWFDVTQPTADEMKITLKQPLSDTDLEGITLVSLTILATSTGNTVLDGESQVVLGIERADVITPEFSQILYEGIISTDLEITNLDELRLTADTNIGDIQYTLSDYTQFFEAVKTADGVEIKKIILSADDIEGKNTFQFTVTATNDQGLTGSTVVILTIERAPLVLPEFVKQTYTGTLRTPITTDSLELEPVLLKSNDGTITFALSGEDTDIIKIETDLTDGVNLGLVDGITIDDIGDRTVLSVIVTATLTESIIGTAVVIIHVEREEIPIIQPEFEYNIYEGLISTNLEIIDLDELKLISDRNIGDIQYTLSDYNHLFEAVKTADGVEIKKINLSADDIEGKNTFQFTVTATNDQGLTGSTVVILTIERAPLVLPEFVKQTYTGTLRTPITTDSLEVEQVLLKSNDGTITFALSGEDTDIIKIETDLTDGVSLGLVDGITIDDIGGRTVLSVIVTATLTESIIGTAVVIIHVEREEIPIIQPEFEYNFYEGLISTNLEITDLDELKLISDPNIGDIQYTLSDYTQFFEAVKTADGVEIKLITLSADDIEDKNNFQFTVTATSDQGLTGSTFVILTIVREELTRPEFEEETYSGNLAIPITPDSFVLEDVILKPHPGSIEFSLSGDDTHLIEIKSYPANGVKLGLVDGITIDNIRDRTVLSVIVTAKLTDTIIGSTVVLIHIAQEDIVIVQPEFQNNFYYGRLSEVYELELDELPIKLIDSTWSDTIQFTKIGDDSKYFIVRNNENNVEIEFDPTTNLDELENKNTLTFSIVATTNGDHIITGTTTVIIELPIEAVIPEIIPTFTQNLYAGSLRTDLSIDLESIQITSETYTDGITFELIDFDYDLFDYAENTPGTIDISSIKITDEILKSKQLFKFNVRATNDQNIVGITSVVIEIPRELVTEMIIPQFGQPLYNGLLRRGEGVRLNEIIQITEATYSRNLEFSLDGGDSDLFVVTNEPGSNIVAIAMKPYNENDLIGKNVLHFAVIGTLTDDIIVTTSVVIDITPMVTLTEPRFAQPLYIGTLTAAMEFHIEDPKITLDSYSNDIKYEIFGDDSDLFAITDDQHIVTITPKQPITIDDIQFKTNLRFTITATKSNGLYGSTAIVIDIPATIIDDVVLPQFEIPYYSGIIKTDLTLELGQIVLQPDTYTPNIDFSLTDDMFEIDEVNSHDNIITIVKSSEFDELVLKDRKIYTFAVVARLGSLIEGTTTIILDIETPNTILVPQFVEPLYVGDLSPDLNPIVVEPIKLTEDSYSPDVEFSLESSFDSYLFRLERTENLVTILPNGITEENTKFKTELKFVIMATKSSNLIGTTVVVIYNPNAILEGIITPKFDNLIYAGSISPELNFDMTDIIMITEATYSDGIKCSVEGGNGLFNVAGENRNIISIGLARNLQQSDINDKKVLSFTIVASLGDLVQGTATVIIDITTPNTILPPEFKHALYEGTLSDTFILDVVALELTEDSYSDDVEFELVDAFDRDLFTITRTDNNIVITSPDIAEDDIVLRPVLKFVVRATKPNGLVGTTVVVINIPSKVLGDIKVPKFLESIYTGSLSTELELDFTDIIQVTEDTYSTAIRFILEGGNSDLFHIIDEVGNQFGIELINPLDVSEIDSFNVLSLTVVAQLGSFIRGTATVLIDIETPDVIVFPVFEQSLYVGSIDDELNIQLDDILLTELSYSPDVKFELADEFDSDRFNIDDTTSGNIVKILASEITEAILKSNTILKFVVKAIKPNGFIGTTVVIITIPANDVMLLEFRELIYRGSLSPELELINDIVVELIDDTMISGLQFNIIGDDDGLFMVSEQNGEKATITTDISIQDSHVRGKNELSFIVEGITNDGYRGYTTIIIDISNSKVNRVPIFENSLYIGSLTTDHEFELDETIMLKDNSYSDDVEFNLVNAFDSKFFTVSRTDNSVDISVNTITEEDIKSVNVLKIMVSATKPNDLVGYAVVVITTPSSLPEDINIPEFTKSIYRDSLPSEMETFSITVGINDETPIPGITFHLIDGDSELFKIDNENGIEAQIVLDDTFDPSDIQGKKVLIFTVEAVLDNGIKGTTTVIIDIPDPITIIQPEFVQPLYDGSLDSSYQLTVNGDIMLTTASYSDDIDFEMADELDYELFEIVQPINGNNVVIDVKTLTEENIKSNAALKIIIRATNTKTGLVGTTALIVEIPSSPSTGTIIPQFEQPLYVILLPTDLSIDDIDPIKILMSTYSSDIMIALDGVDKKLFDFVQTANAIMLRSELTESDIENKQVLSLIVRASLPSGEEGSTVVLFEIPLINCVIPNEDTQPKFQQELYNIVIEHQTTGAIRTVNAVVPSDPTIQVIYETRIDDTELSSKIELNRGTGELTATAAITPNIYTFEVLATNPNDNSVGSAIIKLTVRMVIYCPDNPNDPTVSHSLIVQNLEEESEQNEILDTTITNSNCQYEISTVTPIDLRDLFDIKGNFLTSQSFDRENLIFNSMAVPQIRLVLEIVCNEDALLNGKYMSISYNRSRAIRSTKDDSDETYYVQTNSIVRDAKKTILAIVIKDINDNVPEFVTPTTNNILIGYPEPKLAEKLLPPYLTKVYAIDKDDGINAEILYTIGSNLHFSINSETGVVYPLKNSMADASELDLVVEAIDQKGDGHATPLNIKVKRLEEKNFIVISVENESLDNLDAILDNIETEVNLKINVLNAVIVSTAPEETGIELRSKQSVTPLNVGEETVLRIIGYAFNVNGNPIENDELETRLSDLTTGYTISTQNLIDLIGNCDTDETPEPCPTPPPCEDCATCPNIDDNCDDCDECDDECDNTGLIVGLIILALLFLLALIAIFVMWWRWIRPYRYVKRDSSNEQLAKDFNDTGYTEPVVAPIVTPTDTDIFGKSNYQIKNENEPIEVSSTLPQSSPISLAKSLQSVLDMDNRKPSLVLDKDNFSGSSETDDSTAEPPRERKKSIKFNETVERIDILDNINDKEDTIL